MRRRRGAGPFLLFVLAGAVLLGAGAWRPPPSLPPAGGVQVKAAGPFAVRNSRADRAVLRVPALAPGHDAIGLVKLRNRGRRSVALRLRARADAGHLARVLRLRIRERDHTSPDLYRGLWSRVRGRSLGALGAGRTRQFVFIASLPRDVPNSLQGARATAHFAWTATEPSWLRIALGRHQRRAGAPALHVWVRCARPCVLDAGGALRVGGRRYGLRARGRIRRAGTRTRLRLAIPGPGRAALVRAVRGRREAVLFVRVSARSGSARAQRTLTATRRPGRAWSAPGR